MSRDGPATPTFSFLTTAYRTEDTVGRTIRSVLRQTFQDWELVVVDNGLSDEMVRAVEPFLEDPRITLVRQENAGAAGGTRAAAAHARGRFFVVLNSDDLIEPHYAERMLEVLREYPDAAAVACDATLFTDPGQRPLRASYLRRAGQRGLPDPGRPLRVEDVIDGPCPYYSAPVRREVWHELDGMGGLADDVDRVDDLDFWLRALTAGHVVRMVPDRLGFFRVAAGSVSRPVDAAASEEFEKQLELALRRATERSRSADADQALVRAMRRLGYWQAVRRARVALQEGCADGAHAQYEVAAQHRRTPRVVVSAAALRAAPGLVLATYRGKRDLALRVRWDKIRGLQSWRMRFGHDV